MSGRLRVSLGQFSDKGRKEINQDFHGARMPGEPLLSAKGIALAVADGISSSEVSQLASQSAVASFLEDYYCTSEAWSVRTSAECVLAAANSWLHAQTLQSPWRFDKDRGYVCTLSALVIKSTTAHVLHVGDSRIYLLRQGRLERLTEDHRVRVSQEQSYLARALGIAPRLDVDYRDIAIEAGDLFILATDGVHEHIDAEKVAAAITGRDLDRAAEALARQALAAGSADNLTVQLLRIDELPRPEANEIYRQLSELAPPPLLEARMDFEGYRIVWKIRGSSRSHIYLAVDQESGEQVVIKTPSIDLQADPACLERFLLEEWIARRIDSPHVLKPCRQTRQRNYVYVASEFIEGQTLAQWMLDNPRPSLETVRSIVDQIAKGLQAFHRLEMLHQDLKPDNIMIDRTGTVKIIDFGATRVAGIMEIDTPIRQINLLGAAQYAAPEYFLGENGTPRSDLFSLGVIAYQMLSGKLPYGTEIPKARTRAQQRKLIYRPVLEDDRDIPAWVDEALKKALHPDPYRRYEELSEFVFNLHRPSREFLKRTQPPLIERHPLLFWKAATLILAATELLQLGLRTLGK